MSSKEPTQLGIDAPLGGLLCYVPCCIGFVFSIVAVIVEKQNRFLRFHALQSLLFHAAMVVLSIGVQVVSVVLGAVGLGFISMLIGLAMMLVGLALLGLNIFLMIKAYGGEEFELPVLGPMAKGWV